MKTTKSSGFSLMELLIVIGILGILITVLSPLLVTARDTAYNTSTQTFARNVTLWIASAEAEQGSSAGTFAGSCLSPGLQARGAPSTFPDYLSDCTVGYVANVYKVRATSRSGKGGPTNNGIFVTTY